MATKISTPCRGSHGGPVANGQAGWNAEAAGKEEGNRMVGPQKQHRMKKAANTSIVGQLCTLVCNYQLGIAINLLLLLFVTHTFFPRARRRTSTFFRFSYYNPASGQYGCGTDDLPFVALWVVIFTGLRAAIMNYILAPLARLGGIKTRKGLVRFQEQAWLICYCICSWSLGMYIMYHSEYWFNVHGLWRGWPFREITGLSKFYYLVQWGFWVQQIVVVNIEEKRKDYAQMFTHHIFTCALLFLSYGYYHTRVGIVIMCLMDLVDIILPTAKLLKYLGYTKLCDVFFAIFVLTWTVTRQIFFPIVCWSIYAHSPTDMEPGCYLAPSATRSPNPQSTFIPASSPEFDTLGGNAIWANILKAYTDREGPICWNPTIRFSFLSLLLSLQAIICLWFVMIMKVTYKVLSGQSADDVRSDDEDEADEVEDDSTTTPLNAAKGGAEWAPVEHEVGVESLTFASRKSAGMGSVSRRGRRSTSRASGISIPGHGDRKELLGRIGCDKPS